MSKKRSLACTIELHMQKNLLIPNMAHQPTIQNVNLATIERQLLTVKKHGMPLPPTPTHKLDTARLPFDETGFRPAL
jgi:hypothetical protein